MQGANNILVRESRLKAGKDGLPVCLSTDDGSIRKPFANEIRGSYRVFSYAAKQGADYKGLEGPSGKKRANGKKGKKSSTAIETPDPNYLATAKESATSPPSGRTVILGESSGSGEQTHGNLAAPARCEENPMTARADLPRVEFRRTSVPSSSSASETRPHQEQLTISRGVSDAAANTSTGAVSGAGYCIMLHPLSSSVPHLFGSGFVMETILLDCAKLNYALGRFGHVTNEAIVATKIDKIRSFAEHIMELDYGAALYAVKKEHALVAGKDVQARYNETIYWDIIMKGAELLDPAKLPTPMGRLDNFTRAEKVAARRFMAEAGYGTSYGNQRRYRRLWKSLSDMRKAGVDKLLLYRTKEFDRFCTEYPEDTGPSLVEKVLSWEQTYGPLIAQLEDRVTKASKGDLTGRSWLSQPEVAERLEVPETSWNCAQNQWFSYTEAAEYNSILGSTKASSDELGGFLGIAAAEGGNGGKEGESGIQSRSIFVSLFPRGERSLCVCPILSIKEGDFLGVFAGNIRYSESFDAMYGIRGPREKLWLDYSQVTGVLNLMRVSPPDVDANVCLRWELVAGGEESQPEWRVSVRALKAIKPFEEIIRSTTQESQYLMHQDSACARRGFMR